MEKRIALFGAGDAGRQACEMLGRDCVACFIDNHKQGETVMGIPVFGFEHILENHPDLKVIVASFDYWREIAAQLEKDGIHEYLIWQRNYINHMPVYSTAAGEMRREYLPIFTAISSRRLDAFPSIIVYAHADIADLIVFLLYVCGIAKNIQRIFVHSQSSFIGARSDLRALCACGRNDEFKEALVLNKNAIACLLVAVRRQEIPSSIVEFIDNAQFQVADIYDPSPCFIHRQEITKFKNYYRGGGGCFIIGNGPSLRIEDLDMLHENKAMTFGVNKVYRAFDRTAWRPNFYVVGDYKTFAYNREEILALDLPCKIFIGLDELVPETAECIQLNHYWTPCLPNPPRFSNNVDVCTFNHGSIVYECLQLAAYIGFHEIFLLGVDNTMCCDFHKQNHFIQNYIEHDEADFLINSMMRIGTIASEISYEKAEAHSRENGYRIFNATRGGRVDAFERVDFDSLF